MFVSVNLTFNYRNQLNILVYLAMPIFIWFDGIKIALAFDCFSNEEFI